MLVLEVLFIPLPYKLVLWVDKILVSFLWVLIISNAKKSQFGSNPHFKCQHMHGSPPNICWEQLHYTFQRYSMLPPLLSSICILFCLPLSLFTSSPAVTWRFGHLNIELQDAVDKNRPFCQGFALTALLIETVKIVQKAPDRGDPCMIMAFWRHLLSWEYERLMPFACATENCP